MLPQLMTGTVYTVPVMEDFKPMLYGVPDQVWVTAATQSINLKQAVNAVKAATYGAWFYIWRRRIGLIL